MKIVDIRVREVSVPRIYTTYAADPQGLQPDEDLSRSRYQILEFFTDTEHVGLGEVPDIADRMNPLSGADLRDFLLRELKDGDVADRRALHTRVAAELQAGIHPELRGLILFGVEIALLDLARKTLRRPPLRASWRTPSRTRAGLLGRLYATGYLAARRTRRA